MDDLEVQALINAGANIDAGITAAAVEAGQLPEVVQADPDAAAREWLLVPMGLAWVVTTAFPETKENYTDDANMTLARAIVPVAEKYGWNGIASPEVMLLMATVGFVTPAILAYTERKKLREAESAKPIGPGADGNG